MAVTVTDERTIVSEADATTGWTGSNTVTLYTADPSPIESTGCLGMVVSNTTQNAYFTVTSVNLSAGHLIYVWIFHRAQLDTRANGGLMIQLGDGTNRIGFHVGGSDIDGFRHSEGPVGWQCLVLDTANLPTAQTVFAGSFANLNLTAITQIGVGFKTTVKAVGGVDNCFWDIVRRGSAKQGLIITGGTSGDPGTWEQIAAADRATGNQQAFGIVRKLASGVFGVQGHLTFGDTTGSTAHHFEDTNVTVVFEDRLLFPDKYGIKVVGNATGAGVFRLGTIVGSGDSMTGKNGCSIIAPTSSPAYWDSSDADLDECSLYGCQLVGFSEGVTLSNDATNAPNHDFAGTTFRNCSEVDAGRCFIRNCVFTATTHFRQALEAAQQDDGGVFTDYLTAANNDTADDTIMFPATPANNDAFYIGHSAKFNEIRILVSQAGTGTYAVEYWNGSTWTAVSGLTDTTSAFSKIRRGRLTYTMPVDWATTAVNSITKYWIRIRVTSAGTQARATRLWLIGPADGSALLWNANIDVKRCSFTSNTDSVNDPHGIEHPAAGTFDYYGLTFSGNDYDIEYSATSSNLIINATDGSDPGTYEVTQGGGTVTINNSKTLTVTCKNTAGLAVSGVRIRIEEDDGTLITEGTTNGSGVFTDTYNYTGDQAVNVIARLKGYNNNQASDTITTAGLSVPFTMLRDEVVNLP